MIETTVSNGCKRNNVTSMSCSFTVEVWFSVQSLLTAVGGRNFTIVFRAPSPPHFIFGQISCP